MTHILPTFRRSVKLVAGDRGQQCTPPLEPPLLWMTLGSNARCRRAGRMLTKGPLTTTSAPPRAGSGQPCRGQGPNPKTDGGLHWCKGSSSRAYRKERVKGREGLHSGTFRRFTTQQRLLPLSRKLDRGTQVKFLKKLYLFRRTKCLSRDFFPVVVP